MIDRNQTIALVLLGVIAVVAIYVGADLIRHAGENTDQVQAGLVVAGIGSTAAAAIAGFAAGRVSSDG